MAFVCEKKGRLRSYYLSSLITMSPDRSRPEASEPIGFHFNPGLITLTLQYNKVLLGDIAASQRGPR